MNPKLRDIIMVLVLLFPMCLHSQRLEGTDLAFPGTNFSSVLGSGARAFGMGGAFIAVADDATAASWNPGGLGQLERPELTLVLRHQDFSNVAPASGGSEDFIGAIKLDALASNIDFISFTVPIRLGKFKIVPQISYQRALSFDLESTMNSVQARARDLGPDGVVYILEGTIDNLQKFKGGFDTYNFSLGTRLFKHINIGLSVNYWTKGFDGFTDQQFIFQGYLQGHPETMFEFGSANFEEIGMDIKGVNYNLGVLIEILDNLKLGAVYKSNFDANIEYSLKVIRTDLQGNEERFHPQRVIRSTLEWPESYGVGISYRPIDTLTLSLDATYTRWSHGIIRNFRIPPEDPLEENSELRLVDVYFPSLDVINQDEDQVDTSQIRFGIEYVLFHKKILIPLRIGFFTDTQSYTDSSYEKIKLTGLTLGAGIKWGGFSVDLAVLYESGSFLDSNEDYSVTRLSEVRSYLSTSFSF